MKADFDSLSPEARRLVLVASEEKYRALTRGVDWMKVLRVLSPTGANVLDLVREVLGVAVAKSPYLASTWVAQLPASPDKRSEGWLRTRHEIPIPHLAPEEAARRFVFDHGEPKDGAAYVLDPCVADHYLVPALANERLAQEKVSAFTRIAASLGAKRVELVSGESITRGSSGAGEIPLKNAALQIGLGARIEEGHAVARQVFMELDAPDAEPFVPADVAKWVEIDPSLRALVAARLESHLRTAKVMLAFQDTIDLDAKITAELAARKIGVGGAYRTVAATRWGFEIEFWPRRR